MKGSKMKGARRALAVLLALSLIAPEGVILGDKEVKAQIIDSDYEKDMLWSTSFENTTGFFSNTLNAKGTANVSQSRKSDIAGDLTYMIDRVNISGSASYNSGEVLLNLFDGSTSTKYLTSSNPTEIIVKLNKKSI